jgi:protein involved in polysaccharide export with SLBB domain
MMYLFFQKRFGRGLLLLVLFVFFVNYTDAQYANGMMSQLSDQQLIQLWQKTQKEGMSESDVMKVLVQKGLSVSEVDEIKKRILKLQSNDPSKFSKKNIIKDTSNFLRDTTWVYEVPAVKKITKFYGFDFFNNPNINFTPNFNVATPSNYVLGVLDQLTLTVSGMNEYTNTTKIDREGNYELPHAGLINLQGLTIDQAKAKIKQKLLMAYPALASGRTQLSLSLGNVRSIRIAIIGEAQSPGDYTVSSLASFFNVLYLSGGPSDNGSLRKIELIRANKLVETIDFYQFLQKGMLNKELRLQDQDIIRFPLYQKRVSLHGEVKRPAIYELLENETLTNLINYAGGFGDEAFKELAKIGQIDNSQRKLKDVPATDFSYYIPRNADSVVIEKVLSRFANRVMIQGAVYRPGNYELTDGLTLLKLIQKANGIRDDAFTSRAYIKRLLPGTSERASVNFNVKDLLSGAIADIPLFREDSVVINTQDELVDILSITIAGNVRNPGTYQYRKGISLEDAILMAGGFTYDAANHKVEISRLEKNKADTLANQLLNLITVDVDAKLANVNSKILLEPLDYVFVPKLLNYQSLGSVKVRGEVLYNGNYALERRDETFQDIIKRAGGISPYASIVNAQVYRNNLRVATDLLSSDDPRLGKFLLLPDDSINIPRSQPFVEVKGAVFNPQIISFNSSSFKQYISESGGVTDKGNLRKAYIQYSNGLNKKVNHFLFFRFYPKVTPGSKIIVPEKNPNEKHGLTVFEISALTGTLATLVSLIAVLR